jgi:putative transposase
MISQISQPRRKGYRFSRSVMSYAGWAYQCFSLSLRNVEDLLAERGIMVSYGTIRALVGEFGVQIAKEVRAARQKASDKWRLDKVVRHRQVIGPSGSESRGARSQAAFNSRVKSSQIQWASALVWR